MAQVHMITTRLVSAKPEDVYDLLADYRRRPSLLTRNFTDCRVEEGGRGAGTRFHYQLHAGRRVRDCDVEVSEPAPGRELVEQDRNSSLRTRWTVESTRGDRSRVQVETTWSGAGGVAGFFERAFAPLGLRRIYDQVLDRVAREAGR